jgi:amidohydrolase
MYNEQYFLDKSISYFEEIVSFRRTIHKNPELSFCEVETTNFILEKLNEFGIVGERAISSVNCDKNEKVGVIAKIGKGENCIALRADIDALPIVEETGLEFRSNNIGKMHACGHDFHTAILLGTAKILKEIESELKGTVLLIFQPAEEYLPGGAKIILEEGLLQKYKPKAFFGQHINPEVPVGSFSYKSGPIMASTDELYITITGKSSHAGQPHLGSDVILAAASLVQFYQNIITKFKNPLEQAVISITSLQAGNTTNVYPDKASLLGTMRTYNQNLRNELKEIIKTKSKLVVEQYNCSIDINIVEGYPPVINSEQTTNFLTKIISNTFNEDAILYAEPKMWAEDFAYYSQIAPSTFYFIGVNDMKNPFYPLHNSKLNPSEEALKYGVAIFTNLAYHFL